MDAQIKIKKKCGKCDRIRPIREFKSTNSCCDYCASKGKSLSGLSGCLKCDDEFKPRNKFNKICDRCKGSDDWSVVMYNMEVY